MAKIYSFQKFKLRKRIKDLQEILRQKKETGSRFGFLSMDHYVITNIHKEILSLNEQLVALENNEEKES